MKAELFIGALTAAGGFVGALIGEVNGMLYALIILVALDYITGVLYAIQRRTLDSDVGFRGIIKKVLIFALVIVANTLDVYVLHDGVVTRGMVVSFYIVNEAISIAENAARIGVPLPDGFTVILQQLKRKGEDSNANSTNDDSADVG